MPVMNFSSEFAESIINGTKLQTIRYVRQRPIFTGDTLHLYTGMKTKEVRKLGIGVVTSIRLIEITKDDILVSDKKLGHFEKMRLAMGDGFQNLDKFYAWIKSHYGLPFSGVIINWELKESDILKKESEKRLTYVLKGLFTDVSFIEQHAKKMSRGDIDRPIWSEF
jgi:hypothetical protein